MTETIPVPDTTLLLIERIDALIAEAHKTIDFIERIIKCQI